MRCKVFERSKTHERMMKPRVLHQKHMRVIGTKTPGRKALTEMLVLFCMSGKNLIKCEISRYEAEGRFGDFIPLLERSRLRYL